MQALRDRLSRDYSRVFHSLGAYSVEFTDLPDKQFALTLRFRDERGRILFVRKEFTRQYVFGDSANDSDEELWEYRMRLCRFADEVSSELRQARGL